MRNDFFLLSLLALFSISFLACTSDTGTLDPDKLPYKLEKVFESGPFYPFDLNGDGRDERIYRKGSDLVLKTHDNQTIDQINYAVPIGIPHFLDLESDGNFEILVPYVRNDSLFASFVDSEAEELFQIYLTKGTPRQVPSGLEPWDPKIRSAFLADVNADGQDELITIIATGIARMPRGVWIHSLPDGKLLGEKLIGAIPMWQSFLGDFDRDGRLEILLSTGASDNGADESGLNDKHSYLITFDLGLPPHVQPTVQTHKEMGGFWTDVYLRSGDLDGDGEDEFLAFLQTLRGRPTPGQLQLIDPSTGRAERDRTLSEPLTGVAIVNLDSDTEAEILALGISGELKVLNNKLDLVWRRRVFDESIYQGRDALTTLPDVDGDGFQEIIVHTENGDAFLDPKLRVKAVAPLQTADWNVFRQDARNPPYLHASHEEGSSVYRLVKNRSYLVNRYTFLGKWGAVVGLSLLAAYLIGLIMLNNRKRLRLNVAIQNNLKMYLPDQIEGDFVRQVYEVVASRHSDPLFNVAAFADEIGCSGRKLQRDMQARIGLSPGQFIWTFRLERAKKLLRESKLTIKEIAHKVGFESPEHFSTTFRKDQGVTPSAYRKDVASSSSSKSS